MTLVLDNLPQQVDAALRARARAEGKSVDQVAVEALQSGLGLGGGGKRRDLSDIAGSLSPADAAALAATVRDMDAADLRTRSGDEA